MKRIICMALLLTAITITSCSKNYYSGNGSKSSKGCGCPASN
jgi:predicted small secreted protein